MLIKIIFAGSGGQGVLTMGYILGNAAMYEDFHVTYLPSYGAEVRGGTANCTISISNEEIASPVASSPDIIVALNQPSANTFINRVASGGQMIYNSDLIMSVPFRGDVDLFQVPANTIGRKIGNERSSNMALLGAFMKLTNIIKFDSIISSIENILGNKKKVIESSKKAITEGYNGFPFDNGTI
ncbi:MAG: 2-oxoacid:acceptor oxidoreductase family protein [Spirochaetota bacterium]|nr:2-oxoacid:acceptor oxidoreductase family protein [Spirochaetota bacterium]